MTDLSFPKFMFVPFVFSYLLCVFSRLGKMKAIFKYCIYSLLIFLDIVELYLLCYFGMCISPFASQLLLETNGNEASDFISTYVLSPYFLSACQSMIVVGVVLIILAVRSATLLSDAEKEASTISKVKVDSCSYLSPKNIFILGESFNKYHSILYGYPLTEELK